MSPRPKSMSVFTRLLSPDRILIAEEAADKWTVIAQLMNLLVASGEVDAEERPVALGTVFERERKSSTGIERGVATPHGVYDGVPKEVGVLGIFKEGVDFQARDGKPTHFVLLLLYPHTAYQEHVVNLAGAVRVLASPEVGEQLSALSSSQEVYERLMKEAKMR